MDELSNKVAIVTGSTKGIGKSIAEVFSQKGANVVVTSRNLSLAKEIVKNLNSYDTNAKVKPPLRKPNETRYYSHYNQLEWVKSP